MMCRSNKEHIAHLISIPPGHATLHRSKNLFLSNAHVVSNIPKQCGLYVVPRVPYAMPCRVIKSACALAQCEVHTAEECVLVQCGYCNIKSKFRDEIVLA